MVPRQRSADVDELVAAVREQYGYQFDRYAAPTLNRRIALATAELGANSVAELRRRLVVDEACAERFLGDMSVTVTEMFRDPPFFAALREHVVPALAGVPLAKVWHAGCATGEEAYSMAIFLHEAGCLERCRVYATDFNNRSLEVARRGVYPAAAMRGYGAAYYAAGGVCDFADYYRARYRWARMRSMLRDAIRFAHHDLVREPPFTDADVILCRNVLIYFEPDLREELVGRFRACLEPGGFLCLGDTETPRFTRHREAFEPVAPGIWRRRATRARRSA